MLHSRVSIHCVRLGSGHR